LAPIALAGAALAAAVFVATFSGAEYKFENDIKTHKNSANFKPLNNLKKYPLYIILPPSNISLIFFALCQQHFYPFL
jgi:hypothetical protein